MFLFDIETLGVESTSVILSAAMTYFEPGEDISYQELLNRSIFVKFDAYLQAKEYKRVIDPDTLKWWAEQSIEARNISLKPNLEFDLSPQEGLNILRNYYKNTSTKNKIIWIRGSLDQMASDSLAKACKQPPIASYNVYRDIRTGIDLMKDTSKDGYCKINREGFNWERDVIKHDPVHDCASDAMMILYGE